ncbi:hypothetical protein GCM10009839_67000 [Catenulispora yoronensis]|uniref:Uncharacterized protein n=1 Tax=Catenulispora yoronensis TaxID=450799 RepID=A0ABN2VA03_9ACTN
MRAGTWHRDAGLDIGAQGQDDAFHAIEPGLRPVTEPGPASASALATGVVPGSGSEMVPGSASSPDSRRTDARTHRHPSRSTPCPIARQPAVRGRGAHPRLLRPA